MNYLVLGPRKLNFHYLVIGQRRIDGSFGQGGQGYEQGPFFNRQRLKRIFQIFKEQSKRHSLIMNDRPAITGANVSNSERMHRFRLYTHQT
jgi:hypothetical protein